MRFHSVTIIFIVILLILMLRYAEPYVFAIYTKDEHDRDLSSTLNHQGTLTRGSPGPVVAYLLERWANNNNQSYHQSLHEIDFELKRQLISNDNDNVSLHIVDAHGNAKFTSIQKAIDQAKQGDAIVVYSGLYQESISINKPIWLLGVSKQYLSMANSEKPTLSSNDNSSNKSLINIQSNNVVISGFCIQFSSAYIYISEKSDSTIIFDNEFFLENLTYGINVRSSNCSVLQNMFHCKSKDGVAIIANTTENLIVQNNTFFNLNLSLILKDTQQTIIKLNNFKNCIKAIIFSDTIISNTTCALNNFFDNIQDIYIASGTLIFNLTCWIRQKGNYWDDYNEYDLNNDGIGDIPYSTKDIVDLYPLIVPFNNQKPNMAQINPDEQGILCVKTNEQIPLFVEIYDEDINSTLYGKWIIGSNHYEWCGPYDSSELVHSFHIFNSTVKYPVSICYAYYITMDEYGLSSISEPYEVHIYDMESIRNPLVSKILDKLIPTYFLSGWQ